MEKSFTRADNLHFELKQSGNKTMIWEVTEAGKFKRYEVWRLQQSNYGDPRSEYETGIHYSLASVLSEFEKNEKSNNN
jgi:hypothetical protein